MASCIILTIAYNHKIIQLDNQRITTNVKILFHSSEFKSCGFCPKSRGRHAK